MKLGIRSKLQREMIGGRQRLAGLMIRLLGEQRLRRMPGRLEQIFLHQETDDRRLMWRCAIAAVIMLVSAYPDVIFRGASLSIVNFLNITFEPAPVKVQILPERRGANLTTVTPMQAAVPSSLSQARSSSSVRSGVVSHCTGIHIQGQGCMESRR